METESRTVDYQEWEEGENGEKQVKRFKVIQMNNSRGLIMKIIVNNIVLNTEKIAKRIDFRFTCHQKRQLWEMIDKLIAATMFMYIKTAYCTPYIYTFFAFTIFIYIKTACCMPQIYTFFFFKSPHGKRAREEEWCYLAMHYCVTVKVWQVKYYKDQRTI